MEPKPNQQIELLDNQQFILGPFTAVDADGETEKALAGPVSITGGTVPGTLPGSLVPVVTVTDNGDGTFTVAATGQILGTATITATDGVGTVSYDINVSAGPETGLTAVVGEPETIPVVTPAPALVNI